MRTPYEGRNAVVVASGLTRYGATIEAWRVMAGYATRQDLIDALEDDPEGPFKRTTVEAWLKGQNPARPAFTRAVLRLFGFPPEHPSHQHLCVLHVTGQDVPTGTPEEGWSWTVYDYEADGGATRT